MAGMTDLAIRIATTLDSTGLNKADKSVKSFEKTIKSLGRTLGLTLSATAVVAFGKKAAQAFIADQKEAMQLTQVVKNLGLELSSPAINQYIDSLSKASGVTDSQLRPAFQALLTTTGSLTASQKALQQAIDISVGSGVALETVAQDLAAAYVGQTRGLRKYNLGLSQAQLKTASFEEVTARLNKQFSGANAAFLDTYAGKLQVLSTAAGEAQEKIGAAIIDLTMALAGTGSVDELVTKIDRMADRFVGLMDRFTEGVAIIKAMLGAKTWTGMFKAAEEAQVAEFNRRMKRDYMKVWEGTNIPMSPQALAQQKAAEAAARKRAQELAKTTAKNTTELKKQNALKKAGTVFDLEQIQLIAALKGQLSDEDRKRIEAQLALLNNNDALAQKLTREILMAQDATGGLYRYFLSIGDAKIKNPFAFLDEWIMEFQNKLNNLKVPTLSTSAGGGTTVGGGGGSLIIANDSITVKNKDIATNIGTPFGQAGSFVDSIGTPFGQAGSFVDRMGTPFGQAGSVIELKITGEGDITNAIAKGLQNQSLSTGDSSYINRRTGGFAG
jgi:hypothetical protein